MLTNHLPVPSETAFVASFSSQADSAKTSSRSDNPDSSCRQDVMPRPDFSERSRPSSSLRPDAGSPSPGDLPPSEATLEQLQTHLKALQSQIDQHCRRARIAAAPIQAPPGRERQSAHMATALPSEYQLTSNSADETYHTLGTLVLDPGSLTFDLKSDFVYDSDSD
jgi:hypothetical protein